MKMRLTPEQEKITRLANIRAKFMHKRWEIVSVDFSHKTYIKVSFINSESDFVHNEYPHNYDEVIEKQQKKLLRDVKEFVGGNANMDELLEVMVG